jgi:hypothetical protein
MTASKSECISGITSSQDELFRFRELATEVARQGEIIGVEIVPYRDANLPFFSELASEKRKSILEDLADYVAICQATKAQGYDLNDGPRLLWNALLKFGLRPTSDLFQFAHDGNVIEIHNQNFVQIFRNFRFYECCSYTLEELHCFPWTTLYRRVQAVEGQLIEAVTDIFAGKVTRTLRLDIAPHVIEETQSPFRFRIQAQVRHISPLYDENTGKVAATVVIEQGSVLNRQQGISRGFSQPIEA